MQTVYARSSGAARRLLKDRQEPVLIGFPVSGAELLSLISLSGAGGVRLRRYRGLPAICRKRVRRPDTEPAPPPGRQP